MLIRKIAPLEELRYFRAEPLFHIGSPRRSLWPYMTTTSLVCPFVKRLNLRGGRVFVRRAAWRLEAPVRSTTTGASINSPSNINIEVHRWSACTRCVDKATTSGLHIRSGGLNLAADRRPIGLDQTVSNATQQRPSMAGRHRVSIS